MLHVLSYSVILSESRDGQHKNFIGIGLTPEHYNDCIPIFLTNIEIR